MRFILEAADVLSSTDDENLYAFWTRYSEHCKKDLDYYNVHFDYDNRTICIWVEDYADEDERKYTASVKTAMSFVNNNDYQGFQNYLDERDPHCLTAEEDKICKLKASYNNAVNKFVNKYIAESPVKLRMVVPWKYYVPYDVPINIYSSKFPRSIDVSVSYMQCGEYAANNDYESFKKLVDNAVNQGLKQAIT